MLVDILHRIPVVFHSEFIVFLNYFVCMCVQYACEVFQFLYFFVFVLSIFTLPRSSIYRISLNAALAVTFVYFNGFGSCIVCVCVCSDSGVQRDAAAKM